MKYLIISQLYRLAALIDGSDIKLPNKGASQDSVTLTVAKVTSIAFAALGSISVIVIMLAGIQYIISAGEPQKTAKAKDTILYAVIGLAVAVLSFSIIQFVLSRLA